MIDEYIPSLKKETVTVEKKVYEALQKNNLDLMEKLDKAKEILEIIATFTIIPDAPEDLEQQIYTVYNMAERGLKEIEV